MSLVLKERSDGVVTLTLNDPDRRNVLSLPLCEALVAAVAAANVDPEARLLVITGAGPAFCAGAELEDLEAAANGDTAAVNAVYDSFMAVARSPLPTMAAVNGPAVGAGFNLALACDMRVAAESALFDTRFLSIGLHPGGGHGWMLLRAVGWQTASRLLLCGRSVDGREAETIGLALACVPDGELVATATALGHRLKTVPRELLDRAKRTLRQAAASTHAEAFAHETAEQLWSLRQPAFADLLAAFRRRRAGERQEEAR
jgi:enoyl-CoA hydratase